MGIEPSADDVVWYFGDRGKDVIATLEADKISDFKIAPFAYGVNSSIQILKKNIGTDHIVMSYPDFFQKIKGMFDNKLQQSTPQTQNNRRASDRGLMVDKKGETFAEKIEDFVYPEKDTKGKDRAKKPKPLHDKGAAEWRGLLF